MMNYIWSDSLEHNYYAVYFGEHIHSLMPYGIIDLDLQHYFM